MAQASTSLINARSAALGTDSNSVRQLAARAFAWIREQRRVSHTIATLSDLSDSTLADIGIERSQISRVARYGRDAINGRG